MLMRMHLLKLPADAKACDEAFVTLEVLALHCSSQINSMVNKNKATLPVFAD